AIHSEVGNKMIGAKINGMIVPIDRVLQNGEIVEILTSSVAKGPSRDWLTIVRTGEARNKIRQWFKREKRADNIVMGKTALDAELKKAVPKASESRRLEMVANVAKKNGFNTADDLFNAIGYGEITVTKILPKFKDELEAFRQEEQPEVQASPIITTADVVTASRPRHLRSNSGIIVDGADGCAVKFAKCCNPLPGDAVIGFITKGYGISIHQQDCPNVTQGQSNPDLSDRWVKAWWDEPEGSTPVKSVYEALLQVHVLDEVGALADIANTLVEMKVSILQINSQKASGGRAIINMKIGCKNVEHYNSIVSRLRSLSNIVDVVRGFS
ncbi:MAG: bifunctional (p)ppGpp synthetase/guanosine-3',5'-bis(diphosphate) 3'-pyrophosphohydrolase, partial [Ruminococcaceae bacterium]|nr:bifunctional (p)ppGpp synthetase/guanosine-3',5'-bis(diphosphate) 3'-pyrophosphohydrolase [Oscillospiraceae bacterium]